MKGLCVEIKYLSMNSKNVNRMIEKKELKAYCVPREVKISDNNAKHAYNGINYYRARIYMNLWYGKTK